MVQLARCWRRLSPRLHDADDLPLTIGWFAASAFALYLIWMCRYPPFIDAANVAYSGEVMHDLWRGGAIYGKWYAFRPGVISHTVFYRLYHWLRFLFTPIVCIKILSSAGVLGLPLAMRPLLRRLNRSPWLCLPAFALAFNTNLNMGYLPFVIGIPLIPLALTLIESIAERPRLWRWGLLLILLVASLWFHFFLTAILVPLAALWSILALKGRSRLWIAGLRPVCSNRAGVRIDSSWSGAPRARRISVDTVRRALGSIGPRRAAVDTRRRCSAVISLVAIGLRGIPRVDATDTRCRTRAVRFAGRHRGGGAFPRLLVGSHVHQLARTCMGIWNENWNYICTGAATGSNYLGCWLAKVPTKLAVASLYRLAPRRTHRALSGL